MKKLFAIAAIVAMMAGCNQNTEQEKKDNGSEAKPVSIKAEDISYQADSAMKGFIAYNENATGKMPAVIIVPEWWGVTDYVKNRARQLAEMGYVAMVADFYGNGKSVSTPDEAGALASPFYASTTVAEQRFSAALNEVKKNEHTDTSKVAAIGYCFGGAMVLNMAKLGQPLNGVVSFHGNLEGVIPQKGRTIADVLVCNGAADNFVSPESIATFKKQMDSVGAAYTFKDYANAKHSFTNPGADEVAKKFNMPIAYNAAADSASWQDMKTFFNKIF